MISPLSVADQYGRRIPFSLTFSIDDGIVTDVKALSSYYVDEIVENVSNRFNCAFIFNDVVTIVSNEFFARNRK